MNKLSKFTFEGIEYSVIFLETTIVKEGVSCDVYAFEDDSSKDLGIIHISKGFQTPRQLVLQGERTIEGFISGSSKLSLTSGNHVTMHSFPNSERENVAVSKGNIMQWSALEDSIIYEVCIPAYKDGRFRNLS